MKKVLSIDFVRFCLVGTTGFLINLVLLTLLYKILGLPVIIAQLISAEIALFSNFILHHNWTYKHRKTKKSIKTLLIQFHMSSWVAIVGSALLVSFGIGVMNLSYIFALVVSSSIALLWNFLWSKLVIWKHQHDHDEAVSEVSNL